MAKVSGIFEQFKDLDQIPIDDITAWLKRAPQVYFIENYIANLTAYPQVIPDSEEEIDIELALLREILKKDNSFYDTEGKKILIPQEFITRFPDMFKLIWAFIDAYQPKNVNKILLVKKGYQVTLGTILTPDFEDKSGGVFKFSIEDSLRFPSKKTYNINQGSLIIIPCLLSRCHINFKSKGAKILDKEEGALEAFGGELGIVIDGRKK